MELGDILKKYAVPDPGIVSKLPKGGIQLDFVGHADITRITAELGWKQRVSFEEGVAKIVANIDYWRNAPLWDPASIAQATRTWFEFMSQE